MRHKITVEIACEDLKCGRCIFKTGFTYYGKKIYRCDVFPNLEEPDKSLKIIGDWRCKQCLESEINLFILECMNGL
jgi:hypothetical protein